MVLEVEIDAAPLLLVTSLRSRRASEDGGREDIGLEFAADQHTSRSDLALALFNTDAVPRLVPAVAGRLGERAVA